MTAHLAADPRDWLAAHGDYLYRYALARLRAPHLAEDVVQETMLAALQGSGFAGNSSPRTWLTGILKHKIIDQFRRQQRETALEEPDDMADGDPGMDDFFHDDGHWSEPPQFWGEPGGLLQQDQFLVVLQDCMDRLPRKLARIFMLRDVEESGNDEICKELEITPTNAWVMLYRARMGLRKCLEMNWLGEAIMLNCKQASHLVSQSMEKKLSFRQRLGLRVHLLMCDACSQFSRQLLVLREAISQLARKTENDETLKMSEQARRRIGELVAEHAKMLDIERQHSDQHCTD